MSEHEPFTLERVALAISAGRLQWRQHVLQRMAEREITRLDVLAVLTGGSVIEAYPDDTPYPSALLLGIVSRRPLHVVVALDEDANDAYVITAYEPSAGLFESDWTTRRKT
jgi:hypothetical protein